MSTLIRYCLFQIPGALLLTILLYLAWQWEWMSGGTALVVMAVWLIKDAVLYPVYRPALEGGGATGARAMIGATGTARTDLTPRGLVEVGGERWQARAAKGQTIHAGQRIRVYAASGMVLRVEALQK
jgi:membrane protein implicated in regulation of membrane protease activity